MFGRLLPPKTYILRTQVGEAKDPESGISYEITHNTMSGEPIVQSSKTGKWFVLSWSEILNMARECGIDKEGALDV